MSMIMQMRRATPDDIAKLESSALAAHDFVVPASSEDKAYHDGSIADLDKAWNAIHFLLTRATKGFAGRRLHTLFWRFQNNAELPAGFMMAGTAVGQELAYGPVRLLQPQQIGETSVFLSALPDNFIETNLDFATLHRAGVYPAIWDRKDPDDIIYVSSIFEELRNFISIAAENGEGVAQVIM